jgi:hypothetical protein
MRNSDNRMNRVLRIIAFLTGVAVLLVSIFWSQDGFNFSIAGQSGYQETAIIIGYTLAVAVTVIQFVFSSSYVELNPSLIILGFLAYGYSIYTNFAGITNFQGTDPNKWAAIILGFCMDAAPEPLIAWALGASRNGDFLGNMIYSIGNMFKSLFNGILGDGNSRSQPKQPAKEFHFDSGNRPERPTNMPPFRPAQGQGKQKGQKDRPDRFAGFGE